MIYGLGVLGYDVAADVADDFEHAVVVVHSVLKVEGSVVIQVGIRVVALFELDNLAHQGVIEVMLEVGIVSEEISHYGVISLDAYLEFFL